MASPLTRRSSLRMTDSTMLSSRGAGRQTDGDRPGREPVGGRDFAFRRSACDGSRMPIRVRVGNVIRGALLGADLCQIARVAAVAADDHHQVDGLPASSAITASWRSSRRCRWCRRRGIATGAGRRHIDPASPAGTFPTMPATPS